MRPEDVGGVHVKYLYHCPRQLWLFARGVRPEHLSQAVRRGEAVHETSYSRFREIDLGAARIDHFDGDACVHEVKSSRRPSDADYAQAIHYCHQLQRVGVSAWGAVIHYPAIRRTVRIPYDSEQQAAAERDIEAVLETVRQPVAPPRQDRRHCTGCSYTDYCWTE
jgi:CRISPR-associated exonuclease Cas4